MKSPASSIGIAPHFALCLPLMAPADLKSLKVDKKDFPPLRRLGRKTPRQNAPYHERQRQAMCALDAINAAVGGPEFSVDQLRRAAESVLREAAAYASAVGQASEERLSNHMLRQWLVLRASSSRCPGSRWSLAVRSDPTPAPTTRLSRALRAYRGRCLGTTGRTLVCDACPRGCGVGD